MNFIFCSLLLKQHANFYAIAISIVILIFFSPLVVPNENK